ncbi:MAG: sugar kinase [Actinobacteria bacterium]|nr:sugar kinase [Actinomycetota bacterium]
MSKLIIVGDVMIDITAVISTKLNYATDAPGKITQQPGGAAANSAAWAAVFGAETVFIGGIGDDDAGIAARSALTSLGIDTRLVIGNHISTGSCICIVDPSGERTMIPDQGANSLLQAIHLTPDLLDSASHLHISGYTYLQPTSRQAAIEILAKAKSHGLTTSVDPSSASMIEIAGVNQMRSWLTVVDILFPNSDEAEVLTGEHDLTKAAMQLLELAGSVVVKMGAAGAMQVFKDRPAIKVSAPVVNAVDATGAGDAFVGGYLATWLKTKDAELAIKAGVSAGSECVQYIGARPQR